MTLWQVIITSIFPLKFFFQSERDKDGPLGKWFISEEEYPRSKYPPYCSGSTYLTTINTMELILSTAKNLKYNFIDDMFVTGLAVESTHINNLIDSPDNVVEFYDIANVFLAKHMGNAQRLFDEDDGYFSPMLIAAFDLSPEQVGLENRTHSIC